MKQRFGSPALVAFVLAGVPFVATAPAQSREGAPPAEEPVEEVVRLASWPELEDAATARVDLDRVVKARTPEMAEGGREGLVNAGAGAVPMLLNALGHESERKTVARLEDVLDALTGPAHTRLLAKEFGDRSEAVRVWCLRRVARFPDPGVRADAEAALERAKKRAKKEKDPSAAELELYAAGLCLASTGSLAGLEQVATEVTSDWGRVGGEVRAALAAVRGPEATRAVAPMLEEGSRERKVAGLNLLACCGDRETAPPLVAHFLDTDDNSLRVAAINALRGIVDGAPPIEHLAVFDAIEEAKRWKDRL